MRGKKAVFLVLIMLTTLLQPVLAINDYGEDEDYLGQVVDDYTNEDYVQSKTSVINNATLDCMELNTTAGTGGFLYENFTEYTVVDEDSDFTIIDRQITWSSLRRDATSWVVYDFGVDYFGDFQINFTLQFTDIEAGDVQARDINCVIFLSDFPGTFADQLVGGDMLTVMPRQITNLDDKFIYQIKQIENGVNTVTEMDATQYGLVKHYCIFERVGTTITIRVYSDEARTNLIDTVTAEGESGGYRYFSGLVGYETVTGDPADHSSGLIANVSFRRGDGYSDGHYYTVEMLDGERGLVLMYNATIPAGTGMTVELSDDNSTWVDHNDVPGYDTLTAGYEALDLRDLNTTSLFMRYNLTTGGVDTPRIYQVRLVTITDVELGGAPTVLAMGKYYAMAIILLILGVLIGMGMRGRRR